MKKPNKGNIEIPFCGPISSPAPSVPLAMMWWVALSCSIGCMGIVAIADCCAAFSTLRSPRGPFSVYSRIKPSYPSCRFLIRPEERPPTVSRPISNPDESPGASASTSINDEKWISIDPNDLSGPARYALCISSVVPRPVAVITSTSYSDDKSKQRVNCAPFSYTSLSCHDPPIVTHGTSLPNGKKKDTLRNIETTKEWVFNVLTTSYLEQANECSASLPPETSEVEITGLTTVPCDVVSVPRLAESDVSMECQLLDTMEIRNDEGVHTTTIVIGRVVRFHMRESVLKEDRPNDSPVVQLEKLNAVGRAGDITYWPAGVVRENVLPLPRPK